MSTKSNVNPNHYKTAGRDPQGRAVLQEVERQKLTEKQAQLRRVTAKPVAAPSRKEASVAPQPQLAKNMDENLQASDKRGKRSMAQKRAGSRHELNSTPTTRPVAGAFGKREDAVGILAAREAYDSKKQSRTAKKNTAAVAKKKK
jgi:hypothetical protein